MGRKEWFVDPSYDETSERLETPFTEAVTEWIHQTYPGVQKQLSCAALFGAKTSLEVDGQNVCFLL